MADLKVVVLPLVYLIDPLEVAHPQGCRVRHLFVQKSSEMGGDSHPGGPGGASSGVREGPIALDRSGV